MSAFRDRTLNGFAWSAVSQAGRLILRFVIGVLLARLLSPREFGLVAMTAVITGFASIFAELGFSAALVQKQDIGQKHLSSVFWLNLAIGLLLMLLFMLGSPLIAGFYDEPLLFPITMLASANFFIGSLNIVQNTLMTRSLDFRTLSKVDITAVGVAGAVAIGMAYAGLGVWSLVLQSILISVLTALLLWKLSDWRPSIVFDWTAIKDLLGFSTSLLGTKTLNYWARNIDTLLIGRFLGSNPLGIYNRAYSVMLFPLTNVSQVLSRVMFPSFSIIQEDKRRVKNLYLRVTRVIALLTFPLMLGLLVVAEAFVLTVYGPQWAGMIPILRIFSILGLTQSILTLNGNLYLSQGRADLQFRIGLFLKASIILCIVIGLRWGILGVAVGYATASLINSYPSFRFAGGLVGLTFSELLRNLSGVFGCAAAMALLVWAVREALPATWPPWAYLMVQVPVGLGVYLGLIHLFKVQAYQDVRSLAAEQWRLRRGGAGLTDAESAEGVN